jgi:Sec-independent protein translocase protein TatA
MALDPLEIGVIALMGIAVFIWGPEKVPEIAKQIGTARKQLDVYTKQLNGITKELQTSMNTGNIDNLGNVLAGVGIGAAPAASNAAGQASPSTAASPANPASGGVAATPGSPMVAPMLLSPAAVLKNPATVLLSPPPVVKSGDQLLLEMAKRLGVPTQGKTREDIQNEILSRASQPTEAETAQAALTAPPADVPVNIPEAVPAPAAA